MTFSFADLGFWRLVVGTVVFGLLHGILESHWPAIRGARLGQRPLSAFLFMAFEALTLIVTIAAAIDIQPGRSPSCCCPMRCVFFYLWQS